MKGYNSQDNNQLFAVIKKALWNTGEVQADRSTYEEMKKHAIAALAGPVLTELGLSDELFLEWEKECIMTFIRYERSLHVQSVIPVSVPYVILKGTAASKYYPFPQFRALGDIDIMTRHEDFEMAGKMLCAAGYTEHKDMLIVDRVRHNEYINNDTEVELHSYYAYRNDPQEAKALDDLIIDNIDSSHYLPDMVNGLTLIEHINFHMETGIGLRQIIDWMLFVDRCLPDDKWYEFQAIAQHTGHEQLAIIVTRMCELYLGLHDHQWCAGADPDLCKQLMDYILACGNFGRKQETDDKVSIRFLINAKGLKTTIRYLQSVGLGNWEAARKHRILRPFSWIYQGKRYLFKGLGRKESFEKLIVEYEESRQRDHLFDAIHVAREKKGLVFFRNGEYTKGK